MKDGIVATVDGHEGERPVGGDEGEPPILTDPIGMWKNGPLRTNTIVGGQGEVNYDI